MRACQKCHCHFNESQFDSEDDIHCKKCKRAWAKKNAKPVKERKKPKPKEEQVEIPVEPEGE